MTTIAKIVAGVCSTRMVNDKGRRILVTGITHLVITRALDTTADYNSLNKEMGLVRNLHVFTLCPLLTNLVRRDLCVSAAKLREIPTERLAKWLVHYTPSWLRYQGDTFSIQDDIQQAIDTTLSKA